jgi:hypothetical protein
VVIGPILFRLVIRLREGRVEAIVAAWSGAQELRVRLEPDLTEGQASARALAFPALVGTPVVGERVLLNTSAVTLGLGTGGYHLVVALLDRTDAERAAGDPSGPGHLVKARYTPLQAIVLGVDEQASPHRDVMAGTVDLGGLPVVVADLHSALPAVLIGIQATERRDAPVPLRVAYVMTDGGALPLWFSRTVDRLRPDLCGTVTTGQAFGGDLEAVTVHSGLLACRAVLDADVVIVTQGPGNLGVGTPWGFSGVAVGEVINAVAALGGHPVASLRLSDADPRERHRGISHHSRTAYGRVALAQADVVVPTELSPALADAVTADVKQLAERHRIVEVDSDGLAAALRAADVPLSTMGRELEGDLGYFLAAAAAGRHAATLAEHRRAGSTQG